MDKQFISKKISIFILMMMLGIGSISAQEYSILNDLTSSKIQNANFTEGEPVAVTIRTYDYDMIDVAYGECDPTRGLFGMQAVPGWTANFPSDNVRTQSGMRTDGANAKASGLFEYDDESGNEHPGLGGSYYAPYAPEDATGSVLGMVAVWGADLKYTQEVTLPAGDYMLLIRYQNIAGWGEIYNYNGFVADDGTSYISSKSSYIPGVWETDTIIICLQAETTGNIQIGYKSNNYGSNSAPHLFIDNVKLYSIDSNSVEQAAIEAKKGELLQVINNGKAIGADTSEAQAVYDNPNVTMEEVIAAIESQEALNEELQIDLSEYFFSNPHFDADEPVVGGICTYAHDCETNGVDQSNFSMQPLTSWERMMTDDGAASGVFAIGSDTWIGGKNYIVPTEMSDGSKEGKVLGFVTCWSMTVQYKQACTLPAGQYKLTMSYYNAGGSRAIAKNLIGFVANDGTEYLAQSMTFPEGKWTSEEISFTLEEETSGYFTLGYQATNSGSANMPHFFTDGISLAYIGEMNFDPSITALQGAVNDALNFIDEKFNADLKDAFQNVINAGDTLVKSQSKDVEKNKAAAEAIYALMPDVKASIAAYVRLEEFQNSALANALSKYEATLPALVRELEVLDDDVTIALAECNWTIEEIEATIASLDVEVKASVRAAWEEFIASGETLDHDFDISALFNGLGYTYSTSILRTANIPDKQWNYGNAITFQTQYGTAEVWNLSPFTVSQTLENMPKGKYTITTRAFYRTAGNEENYNYYDAENPKAFVFAGHSKTALANQVELASDEGKDGWAEIVSDSYIYVPNSQRAGYEIFNDEAYDAVVTKSVSTVLNETGDLTFGVTADAMDNNCWVLWYNFSIAYNAVDTEVFNADLQGLITEFHNYYEEQYDNMNSYERNLCEDADYAAQSALGSDVETIDAASRNLNAAFDEVKAGVAAWISYEAAINPFYEAMDEYYDKASVKAQKAFDVIAGLIDSDAVDEYCAADVNAFVEQMAEAVECLRIPNDLHDATVDNPVDATVCIMNPSFETGDLRGWDYYHGIDTRAADNSNSTYSIYNADGYFVFNTWNSIIPDGGLWLSQTVRKLPAGNYRLDALLASDAYNIVNLEVNGNTNSYEMMYGKETGTEVSVDFELFEGEDLVIKASSQTWFKADNFRLTYFGDGENHNPAIGEDMTAYIVNPDFDEDLTWYADGSKKGEAVSMTELSSRSIAYVTEDGSVYATVNPNTPRYRYDGRTYDATNGFIGQIEGWTVETFSENACEWIYFGAVPYDLEEQAIPVADDGESYLAVPARPDNDSNNEAFLHLRAGWGAAGSYKQTINLPTGKYRLNYMSYLGNDNTVDASSFSFRGRVQEPDGEEPTVGEWTPHSVDFLANGDFTIQFGISSTQGLSRLNPILWIDNVTLTKIADVTEKDVHIDDIIYYMNASWSVIEEYQTRYSYETMETIYTSYDDLSEMVYGNDLQTLDESDLVLMLDDVKSFYDWLTDESNFAETYLLGDANCDGTVDVVDVTTVVDFILERSYPSSEQWTNSDVNYDGSIDVVDLTSIVQIILGTYDNASGAYGAKSRTVTSDALTFEENSISLENSRDYVGFQMDVTVSDDAQFRGVQLSDRSEDHSVTYSRIAENTYRIVSYSVSGTPFNGNAGTLLNVNLAGGSVKSISNAVFSNGSRGFAIEGGDGTTNLDEIANGESAAGEYYDLSGRRVATVKKGGIYLKKGGKVLAQ